MVHHCACAHVVGCCCNGNRRSRWGGQLDVVFPSRRDEAATPTGPTVRRVRHPFGGRQAAESDDYSVMSWIFAATSAAAGSTGPADMAMSLVMSPSTLILPAMKACMPGLRVALDQDRLGRDVVDRDRQVGALEVAEVHLELAVGGVHVGVDGLVAERHLGDDLVHPHDVCRGRSAAGVLLADGLGRIDPLLGQEHVLRHRDPPVIGSARAAGTGPAHRSAGRAIGARATLIATARACPGRRSEEPG